MKLVLALASITAISLTVGTSALDDARIQRNLRLMEKVGGKRRSTGDRMLADLDGSMSMANFALADESPTSTSNAKSSKVFQVQLEEYGKVQPANFEGTYKICHYSATRNSASGIGDGVYHACPGINVPDWARSLKDVTTFTKKDDFGAYQSDADGSPSPGVGSFGAEDMGWAGYASGNVLKMTSFGVGVEDGDGDYFLINDTPDTKTCTLYKHGIMECETVLTEYCSAASVSVGSCDSEDEGKWQNMYTIKSVMALAGATCPAPPAGFCETKNLPEDPPFGGPPGPNGPPGMPVDLRRLQQDAAACPFLAQKMP